MKSFKFEAVIHYDDDVDTPTEQDLNLGPLYYGDKHSNYVVMVVNGTIEEFDK